MTERQHTALSDPLTCTCARCTEWRESVRDKAHAARTSRTKKHSLAELQEALATGEGPASIYELLRRCGA